MNAAITQDLRFRGFRLLTVQKIFSVVFICFYKTRLFKIGAILDIQ